MPDTRGLYTAIWHLVCWPLLPGSPYYQAPLIAVPNVTTHLSTASVPILYVQNNYQGNKYHNTDKIFSDAVHCRVGTTVPTPLRTVELCLSLLSQWVNWSTQYKRKVNTVYMLTLYSEFRRRRLFAFTVGQLTCDITSIVFINISHYQLNLIVIFNDPILATRT